MKYHNTYHNTDDTFFVLICTRVGQYFDRGYATLEEAAWQADRAKHVLNAHGFLGRLSEYNFPERLKAETESAWSVLPPPLVAFYCKHLTTDTPVSEDSALQIEEAKRLVELNEERQRRIDEETKKLQDEHNEVLKAKLLELSNRAGILLRDFDALKLPKSTKEHNTLAAALSVLHVRLMQL